MEGLLQFKNLTNSVTDVDVKNRVVTGYLATFDEDKGNDTVVPGAFQKSLNERRDQIFFLNQHQFSQPHGKFAVLREDAKGLYFESNPLIDTSYSTDALKLYEAGIMTEHSIGYKTMDFERKTNGGRYLKEVKLFEGSNVTIGMNGNAQFMGFKDMTVKDIDTKIKKIVGFMRKGDITDDGFALLEYSLKQLQLFSYELGQLARQDNPPSDLDTELKVTPLINTIKQFSNNI